MKQDSKLNSSPQQKPPVNHIIAYPGKEKIEKKKTPSANAAQNSTGKKLHLKTILHIPSIFSKPNDLQEKK